MTEVVRFDASEVYHYLNGRVTACGDTIDEPKPGHGDRNGEREYAIVEEEEARFFFDLCGTCERAWDSKHRMTTNGFRVELANTVGVDLGPEPENLNKEALRRLYETVVLEGESDA